MSSAPEYLVTGGCGFLGAALVRRLVADGNSVRVFDNSFRGSRERLGDALDAVDFVEGDIRDERAVREAVSGVRVVVHMAAINGTVHFYEIPEEVLRVGVLGTVHVLEAARDSSVEKLLFASSSEVYQTPPMVPTPEEVPLSIPDPFNPRYSYGGSKLIGEILAANLGRGKFQTVLFRPHNIYGAEMGHEHVIPEFAARLRDASRDLPAGTEVEFPIQGSGEETRAFCHVDDFTDGLCLLIEKGEDQHVYHIGNDEEVSIRDLAGRVADCLGYRIALRHTPVRAGGTPRRCPDITRLRGLGYEPKLPLAKGLPGVVQWYSDWADRTAAERNG